MWVFFIILLFLDFAQNKITTRLSFPSKTLFPKTSTRLFPVKNVYHRIKNKIRSESKNKKDISSY